MHRLIFIALIALAACAQSGGNWPSLNPRPIEVAAAQAATAPVPTAPAAPVSDAPARDVDARLATVTRDLDALAARWALQARATSAAVAAAKGTAARSEAWSSAQLELSRLEQAGNQMTDMRDRLDSIAGDLALAAQSGDIGSTLARTGAQIARVEQMRTEHRAAFATATAALPR